MSAELEIKLNIGAEALQKLLGSPLVKEKIISGSEGVYRLETSYYDMPSFKLMHSGIAYRVRKNGDKYEATIKTEEASYGGFSSRNEYNIDLPDGRPVLQGFKEAGFNAGLEKILDGEPLEKLFTVDVERRLCLLKVSEETTLEMAVDCGKITGSGGECPINETELEIKTGTKADLIAYTAQIAGLVPVAVEPRSKYERGMKLCGNDISREIPHGKLKKIDVKAPARSEMLSLYYYYGDQCLRLQNKMAEDKVLLAEADEVMLPRVRHLQALLNLSHYVMAEGEYEKGQKLLLELLQPLQALFRIKRLSGQWQAMYGQNKFWLERSTLDDRIEEHEQAVLEVLQRQMTDGTYARIIFWMLAWAENSVWKDGEITVEQLAANRLEEWHKKLKDLNLQYTVTEEEARRLLELTATIIYIRRSIIKTGKMCRRTWNDIKALYRSVRFLHYDVYGNTTLLKGLVKGGSRSLYRDMGLVLGWRLQTKPVVIERVLADYNQLLVSMKKDK